LIEKTHFAMAQQDVRYYLNGTLIETSGTTLRAVATDGHRLSMAETELSEAATTSQQVIVPRKGILELQRILAGEGELELTIGSNHVRAQIGDIRFTSKLIDGKFPEYGRVIPAKPPHTMSAGRDLMRQALQRTSILSNEKYRGVRLTFGENSLTIQAHNPEQEEAEDQIEVSYSGAALEIGFNVTYLLEALAAIDVETVDVSVTNSDSSCLIRAPGDNSVKFVVMPMRL
jgi:DNA polymerase-3 subunit beta